MIVYRDSNGDVINIGEWVNLISITFDDDGNEISTIINPIPDGYLRSDEDVTIGEAGEIIFSGMR